MKKYVAHVTIETLSALKIGSSAVDFIVDMPILRDWNRLPYIQGTSIAGVLRSKFDEAEANAIFGYVKHKKDEGEASQVVVTSALVVDENDRVHEKPLLQKSLFLKIFEDLPIREHTAIDERGVVKDKSKFDEEVLYRGVRFRFGIESENRDYFFKLLDLLGSGLRLGGGVTKGFGAFRPVRIEYEEMDLERYSRYSGSLNERLAHPYDQATGTNRLTQYRLELVPEMSFHFGSGFGDVIDGDEVDKTYVTEPVVDYEKGCLSEEKILVPASSVKGAIAHRALFHYNRILGKNSESKKYCRSLPQLFGAKKGDQDEGRGKVFFSDCYLNEREHKVFDHVKIDRFTGGAYEGALFNENCVISAECFVIEMEMEEVEDHKAVEAFEAALKDIATGMLPLGGSVMKGHGVFNGEVYKNGERI